MEIRTKLNIDDYAFILFNNKIYEVQIESIDISIECNGLGTVLMRTIYTIDKHPVGSQYTNRFIENEIFKTKEELIESLLKD